MRSPNLILSLAAVLLMVACQTAEAPSTPAQEPVGPDIEARIQEYIGALAANDAAALAAMFTDDAIMMSPNATAVSGKQAIQDLWTNNFEAAAYQATVTSAETETAGGWSYSRGAYTLTVTPKGGDPVEDTGKWLNILKSMPDGTWKIHRHIWNSDSPLPAPQS